MERLELLEPASRSLWTLNLWTLNCR